MAVLIPALDESATVADVLHEYHAALPEAELVVVDNGSTDGTVALARSAGAEVVHEAERGYGAACLRGLRHLANQGRPPEVLAFLDADGSDDPGLLADLVAPLVAEGGGARAGLVLGVRQSVGGHVGTILPHARFGNRLVLSLTALLFGRRFADLPPFRAISFQALQSLEMDDRTWGWTLQMQIRALRAGLAIVEQGMPHADRVAGESKISGSLGISVRVGLKMLWTLIRERLR